MNEGHVIFKYYFLCIVYPLNIIMPDFHYTIFVSQF